MYDVVEARYVDGYKIEVTFENGRKGVVDLKDYAGKGGVFSRFADMDFFKKFRVNRELGTLCWPDGVDISPEILYHRATGEPLPDWMREGEGREKAV